MEDSRRTYSVLVVAAAAKFHMSLREMLPEDRYDPMCAAGSVSEARRALLERPFDIVVISTPLPDEFGTKLALHIIDKSSAGVLLLVKAEHYPDLAARLAPQGILLLQKPTTPPLLSVPKNCLPRILMCVPTVSATSPFLPRTASAMCPLARTIWPACPLRTPPWTSG